MFTQCPNPKCKELFEVSDEREGKNGPCPTCGQVITFRSLRVIRELEAQQQKRQMSPQPQEAIERAPFSALLEDIRSLWNVGSIFRTADGAGFGALYLCGITGCPPNKAIAKTSLGAEDHVRWRHYTHALEILPELKQQGIQLVALERTEKSEPLQEALRRHTIRPPMCLIVGNEVAGVCAESLALADATCHLPMRGIKGSLNVAVAFGIGAYMIRQALSTE